MSELTEAERTCLRWAAYLNPKGVGFLGPTVKRHGPLPVYSGVVGSGLARCVEAVWEKPDQMACGYWLTEAGQEVARSLRPAA